MKLIADSGSTKTDWCVIDNNGLLKQLTRQGINPYYQTEEEINQEIKTMIVPQLSDWKIKEIYFYGAGCTTEKKDIVTNSLMDNFHESEKIEVHSDLLGASRAMCQNEKGIVGILGTGSNSALYDGKKITHNTAPLGYILGDEGSGAVLGKKLINLVLKNQVNDKLKQQFLHQYNITPNQIIENVYNKPFPNRFLAQFVPFILKNIDNKILANMVETSFSDFLSKNILKYPYSKQYPVHFVGSIAFYFQNILRKTVLAHQLTMGNIEKTPIKQLVFYHLNKL